MQLQSYIQSHPIHKQIASCSHKSINRLTSSDLTPITLRYMGLAVGVQKCLAPLYDFNTKKLSESIKNVSSTLEVIQRLVELNLLRDEDVNNLFSQYKRGEAVSCGDASIIAIQRFAETCQTYKIDTAAYAEKYSVEIDDYHFDVGFDEVFRDEDETEDNPLELLISPHNDLINVFCFNLPLLPQHLQTPLKNIVFMLQNNLGLGVANESVSYPLQDLSAELDQNSMVGILNEIDALPDFNEDTESAYIDLVTKHDSLSDAYTEMYMGDCEPQFFQEFLHEVEIYFRYLTEFDCDDVKLSVIREQLQGLSESIRCEHDKLISAMGMILDMFDKNLFKDSGVLYSGNKPYSEGFLIGFGSNDAVCDLVNPAYHDMQQIGEYPFIVGLTNDPKFYEKLASFQLGLSLLSTLENVMSEYHD